MPGRTIREAIKLALEGLAGNVSEWVVIERSAMRAHVSAWVFDYAANRGVILTQEDIDTELYVIVAELLGKRPPPPKTIPVACGECYGCATSRACTTNKET